jgi:hypothetical protein
VQVVRDELARQQRDPASFALAKRVYIVVDDDPGRAHDRMAAALDRLYGYFGLPDMTPVSVFGPDADRLAPRGFLACQPTLWPRPRWRECSRGSGSP